MTAESVKGLNSPHLWALRIGLRAFQPSLAEAELTMVQGSSLLHAFFHRIQKPPSVCKSLLYLPVPSRDESIVFQNIKVEKVV